MEHRHDRLVLESFVGFEGNRFSVRTVKLGIERQQQHSRNKYERCTT